MTRLLLLLLLLGCGARTEYEYISPEGLQLYDCETKQCLEVMINGNPTSCIYDTAARGTLWLSERVGDSLGLFSLWQYETDNSFGNGTVLVSMLSAAQVCWQICQSVEGQEAPQCTEHCEETYPMSADSIYDCLFGLGD